MVVRPDAVCDFAVCAVGIGGLSENGIKVLDRICRVPSAITARAEILVVALGVCTGFV
jgi:hypothetical protein